MSSRMAACASLMLIYVILVQGSVVSADQLTVSPKQSFGQGNRSVRLVWRYQSEELIDTDFGKNFVFYHDGKLLENVGGGPSIAYPGKPYVDYALMVNELGEFTGNVGQLTATANIYVVKYEAEIMVVKAGESLLLTCDGGPNDAVKLWLVDDVNIDQMKDERFTMTYDGSLFIQKIEFLDALRRIRCRQFFTLDDLDEYKTNKLGFPAYKTAVTDKPVLVYRIAKQSDSTYLVEAVTWKDPDLLRVCYLENGEIIREETDANNSVVLGAKVTKYSILFDNTSLVSGTFEGSEVSAEGDGGTNESDSAVGIIIGVVVGILVTVAVLLVFLIFARRHKKLCFKEKMLLEGDEAGMKPLVPKDDKNGIQDAVELKEIKEMTETERAVAEVESLSDDETNPLLMENYKKKEEKEEEKYTFERPKYLQNKLEEKQDDTDSDVRETEIKAEDETYDFLVQLDAVAESWDELKEFTSKIDDFLESHLKIPAKPVTEISGSLYWTGKDILPRGFVSYEASSESNCLYNSVSSVLYGNEDHTNRLRLASLWDGMTKSDFYIKQYFKGKDKDSMLKFMGSCLSEESVEELDTHRIEDIGYLTEFIVHRAVKETAIPDSKCNPLQVQFLSSAIDLPILQYFQKGYSDFYGRPVKDYEVVKPAGMTGSVKGQNKECVCILWVYESQEEEADSNRCNYIVPVIKKIHKHKDKTKESENETEDEHQHLT